MVGLFRFRPIYCTSSDRYRPPTVRLHAAAKYYEVFQINWKVTVRGSKRNLDERKLDFEGYWKWRFLCFSGIRQACSLILGIDFRSG